MTEMGEFLVGAWLRVVQKCDFVQYNARLPERGLPGLGEVDVVGLDLKNKTAYLCGVVTHLRGLGYVDYPTTMKKLRAKLDRDKLFANRVLKDFLTCRFMLWSPVVPEGKLTAQLVELEKEGMELVINGEYAERLEELKKSAEEMENDTGNPAFRLLQILEHVHKD